MRAAEITLMLECLKFCDLVDVKAIGRYFTWNSKQAGDQRVFSRIDIVLANNAWLKQFSLVKGVFLPEGNFDHSLMLINGYHEVSQKKPFRC